MTFDPVYTLNLEIVHNLMRIEAMKERSTHVPLTPKVFARLRETSRLHTAHYSTAIEGNSLTIEQVEQVVIHGAKIPGRERDMKEVHAYYDTWGEVEQWAQKERAVTEDMIRTMHGFVMNGVGSRIKPTPYRDGQNVIRESGTRRIVYLPPEAHDVPELMSALVQWINDNTHLPAPLVAGIAHYQFATIHPYYDGNGRTARLLTTLILHQRGYSLKGVYCLEEYYAQDLSNYYRAISIGDSHNYYMGRVEADITPWIAYFIQGMVAAFEKVLAQMEREHAAGASDDSTLLVQLDAQQKRALKLFERMTTVTSQDIGNLFGYKARMSSHICAQWVNEGFLEIVEPSRKKRSYRLGAAYRHLI